MTNTTKTTVRYQIETRGPASRDWTTDGIGAANEFATEAEAEATIEALRNLGDDWAEAEYRVTEVAS